MDVLAAYREVGSYRGAAELCGTTHKTVKRIVERHNRGGSAPERKDRGHNYDEVSALVRERVEKTNGKISAKRLLPAARAAGYGGSARNFRRLVASVKAQWRRGHHRGRRPAVWTPGDTLVIDWGVEGGLQTPHPFADAGRSPLYESPALCGTRATDRVSHCRRHGHRR